MRFRNRSGHIIDFLFPLVLFCVLAVSALTVILFAANVYREVTETSSLNLSAWTALTYLREKIHQNDQGEEIIIGTFDEQEALVLAQTVGGQRYCTYIYGRSRGRRVRRNSNSHSAGFLHGGNRRRRVSLLLYRSERTVLYCHGDCAQFGISPAGAA